MMVRWRGDSEDDDEDENDEDDDGEHIIHKDVKTCYRLSFKDLCTFLMVNSSTWPSLCLLCNGKSVVEKEYIMLQWLDTQADFLAMNA